MRTISIDFDGVLHSYEHGWADGTIYGTLLDGAAAALHRLLAVPFAIIVQTCRTPPHRVAMWITEQTGIPAIVDTGATRFWTRTDCILVTGSKLPAIIYVDDRGYRFTTWDQTLLDLPALM